MRYAHNVSPLNRNVKAQTAACKASPCAEWHQAQRAGKRNHICNITKKNKKRENICV